MCLALGFHNFCYSGLVPQQFGIYPFQFSSNNIHCKYICLLIAVMLVDGTSLCWPAGR